MSRSKSRELIAGLGALALACLLPVSALAVLWGPPQTLPYQVGFGTRIVFGPEDPDSTTSGDGCLYTLDGVGTAHRICFDDQRILLEAGPIFDLAQFGPVEFALGLAFHPASDPAGTMWMAVSWSSGPGSPFAGRIALAESLDGGASWAIAPALIRGLPQSAYDHQVNNLSWGPDGCLWIGQGGVSNVGYDFERAESRFSGAILRACFDPWDPGEFDGDCGQETTQESCDLDVWATGLHNPFDLIWHPNSRFYATDNDVNPGFRDDCDAAANTFGCPCQLAGGLPIGDELNLIEPGAYYGFPNPYRAHPEAPQCQGGASAGWACSLDEHCIGGTCEVLDELCLSPGCKDTTECYYFGYEDPPVPGEEESARYREPIAQESSLLEGIAIYGRRASGHSGPGYCSSWDGDLLVATGSTPWHFALSETGEQITLSESAGLGSTGYDLAVGDDGTLYVRQLATGSIQFTEPLEVQDREHPHFFGECDPVQEAGAWSIPEPTAPGTPQSSPVAGWIGSGATEQLVVLGESGSTEVHAFHIATGNWTSSSDPLGPPPLVDSSGHRAAVVLDGELVLVGGTDPLSAATWTYDGQAPPIRRADVGCPATDPTCLQATAVGAGAIAVLRREVVLVGGLLPKRSWETGRTRFQISDRVFFWNPEIDSWRESTPLPVGVAAASAVGFEDRLFVLGGKSCLGPCPPPEHGTQIFDPATGSWDVAPPPLEPCSAAGTAVVVEGQLLLFGGVGDSCSGRAVQAFDPRTETWRQLAQLPDLHAGAFPAHRDADPNDGLPDLVWLIGGNERPAHVHEFSLACERCVLVPVDPDLAWFADGFETGNTARWSEQIEELSRRK